PDQQWGLPLSSQELDILMAPWDGRHSVAAPAALECGGKRSATPLWFTPRGVPRPQSAVAAGLCGRTPKRFVAHPPDSSVIHKSYFYTHEGDCLHRKNAVWLSRRDK